MTELVIVTTDWELQDAGAKTYGMCFIRVSPPYDHMNFKRGFSLSNPTHQRCALFSLIMGLELLESIPVTTKHPEYVVSTKHAWIYDVLNKHLVDKWENSGHWPKNVAAVKGLLLRARDVLADLFPLATTLVYIKRDDDEKSTVNLISEKEDTDVDAITSKGGGKAEIEKALLDMRMRNVKIQELMESGARGSRMHHKIVEKRKETKKKIAKDKVNGSDSDQREGGGRGGGEKVRPAKGADQVAPVAEGAPVGREQCTQDGDRADPQGNGGQALSGEGTNV
ncbi:MAG: hypothetical protein P4L69_11355 [Desulfosporosinus sp.]|nr:hypothetical protein [Desulfosporosinus sp.]